MGSSGGSAGGTRGGTARRRVHWWHVAIVIVTAGFTVAAAMVATATTSARHHQPTAYQLSLRAKVDTAAGAPRSGRDPASQRQTSLAEAASQAVGNGTRTDKPARAVTRNHKHDVLPGQVLTAPKVSHQLSSGCAVGYGQPGVQCLPAKGPNGVTLTCMDVMDIFPNGVDVLGKDWLKLDTDHDGTACDAGDKM